MCTESVAKCPVCLETITLKWKYCMPYLKTSLEVRRQDEGLIPPASWFTSHRPDINQAVRWDLTAQDCPNGDCPSKLPSEDDEETEEFTEEEVEKKDR
ncbi:hypothetical protein F66182_8104 [Fusarium sp. NRRL 66182]|nr:hypothetical protein F66182_8104 [Fusarium sp. NRRL 66182]